MKQLALASVLAAAVIYVPGACAGPPEGIDSLSPRTLKAGPALASDIVLGSAFIGGVGLGIGAGVEHGDWRGLTATSGTLAVTVGITELTKVLAGRRRPYTWDPKHPASAVQDYCAGTAPDNPDDCKSFYSGHTALTAASSFSAVRAMHLSGHLSSDRDMALAYSTASVLTLSAGTLRVAAGKHYVTDVVVGALVGAGLGLLGPSLAH